jgi:hypothetical protein
VKPPRFVAVGLALLVGASGLLVATPSLASWTDIEHVRSDAAAADCTVPGSVDSTAWGRMLTGTLLGTALDPVVAIDGITVDNIDPALNSTASTAAAETDLGSDAWSADFALSVLSALDVGAGIPLPFDTDTGSYTQYGRATSDGISVGAAGAITTAAGGLASLDDPGSATPRLATLRLSTLIDSALPGLGVDVADLADVELRIGTLGAIAELDSCASLWSGSAPGADLVRDYLVQDLAVALTSATVTDVAADIRSAIGSLEVTLDALAGSQAVPTALQSTLDSALDLSLAGIGITLGTVDSLSVAVNVDLAPVQALVTGTLTDGAVSVNLGTGEITADLEALFGAAYASSTGLNGQDPNTSVLTPEVLSAISLRAGTLMTTFVTTTIADAVTAAIDATSLTVSLGLRLNAIVPDALIVNSTFTGTIGGFTGVAGQAAPIAATTVSVVPGLGLLGATSATLNSVLGLLTSGITSAITTSVLPAIGTSVVAPVKATAATAAGATITTLTGTTIPAFVTQLAGLLTVLGTLVEITVNGRPDAAGSVGSPSAAATGRYFETALHVGVVNGSAASVASLFFANASVGPNALR